MHTSPTHCSLAQHITHCSNTLHTSPTHYTLLQSTPALFQLTELCISNSFVSTLLPSVLFLLTTGLSVQHSTHYRSVSPTHYSSVSPTHYTLQVRQSNTLHTTGPSVQHTTGPSVQHTTHYRSASPTHYTLQVRQSNTPQIRQSNTLHTTGPSVQHTTHYRSVSPTQCKLHVRQSNIVHCRSVSPTHYRSVIPTHYRSVSPTHYTLQLRQSSTLHTTGLLFQHNRSLSPAHHRCVIHCIADSSLQDITHVIAAHHRSIMQTHFTLWVPGSSTPQTRPFQTLLNPFYLPPHRTVSATHNRSVLAPHVMWAKPAHTPSAPETLGQWTEGAAGAWPDHVQFSHAPSAS